MKCLISLLRSRRGETLVEILVSMVLFLMIMAVLSGAMGFAAKAQVRAEELLRHSETVQANLRTGGYSRVTTTAKAFTFQAISKDEQHTGAEVFVIHCDGEELLVKGSDACGDVVIHRFASEEQKAVTP